MLGGIEGGNELTGEILTVGTNAYVNFDTRFLGGGNCDNRAAARFGPLKSTLGVIPAIYANDNVRSPFCYNQPLTNAVLGSRRYRKPSQGPSLTHH